MEDQRPCTSSTADNSAFHLIEIEDDFPESTVPPEKENLVQPLVDSDTSKEQEATNVSLTRSEDENAVSEDPRGIYPEFSTNMEQAKNPVFDQIRWATRGTPKVFGFRKEILYPESQLWKRESTGDPFHLREGSRTNAL